MVLRRMKSTISIVSGCQEACASVNQVLKKMPPHWQVLLPEIHFVSVSAEHLPVNAIGIWGIGEHGGRGLSSRKWSVRLTRTKRYWRIALFLSGENDDRDEYRFRRNIISAILSTATKNKKVMEMVSIVAARCYIQNRMPHELLTREMPAFLLNKSNAEVSSPNLVVFFERLDAAFKKLAHNH